MNPVLEAGIMNTNNTIFMALSSPLSGNRAEEHKRVLDRYIREAFVSKQIITKLSLSSSPITKQGSEGTVNSLQPSPAMKDTILPSEQETNQQCGDLSTSQITQECEVTELVLTKPTAPVKLKTWNNLLFAPGFSDFTFNAHLQMVSKGVKYSSKHLKAPSTSFVRSRSLTLENGTFTKNMKKTLVLDMEDTLVHACKQNEQGDFTVLVPSVVGEGSLPIEFKMRPYLQEFLAELSKYYEIVMFAGSSEALAKGVASKIDPERKYISHVLNREHCLETKKGLLIKDLRLLSNRELKNLVIVDNLVHSFAFQIENGIPILAFSGDRNDQELKYLIPYLSELSQAEDVRVSIREKFGLLELVKQ